VEEDGDEKSRRTSPHRRGFAKQDDDRRRLHDRVRPPLSAMA
jgi:hypothetical protein